MDITKLSDSDLIALKSGNIGSLSNEALMMLKEQQADVPAAQEDSIERFKPTKQRANSSFVRGASSAASGFNKGMLTNVPGIAMDTVVNAYDLLKAGAGYTQSKLTGKPPSEVFDPTDRRSVLMTSAWLQDLLSRNKTLDAAINQNKDDFPAMHLGGQAVASALAMRDPRSLAGGAREVAKTAAIVAPAAMTGQKIGEATGIPEAGLLAELALTPVLAQSAQIAGLRPRMILDDAATLARKALRPFNQQQIDEGKKIERFATSTGNSLFASQALKDAPTVAELENMVLDSPWSSKRAVESVGRQPFITKRTVDAMGREVGKPNVGLDRANKIEAAAETGLEMPRDLARQASQPFYDFLKENRPQLPEAVRWSLAGKLENLNKKVGLLEDSYAGGAVSDVAKTATVDSPILRPQPGKVPFRRSEGGIYELDNYLKEINSRINKLDNINADSKQSVERAGLRPAAAEIRQALVDNSPELRAAKDVYHNVRTKLEEQVRNTALKDMAPRPNSDGTIKPAARWGTLESLLKRDQSPDDLKRANRILSRTDPDAVADLTRKVINDAITEAYSGGPMTTRQQASNFVSKVRSVPNLDTALEITAKRNGARDPKAAATGFMKMLDVVELSTLPSGSPGGGGLAGKVEQTSGSRLLATFGFGNQLARQSAVLRRVQGALDFSTIRRLEGALFSPDKVAALERLAAMDPFSKKAANLVQQIISPAPNIAQSTLAVTFPTIQEILNEQSE